MMVDIRRRSSDLFGYTWDLLLHMLGGIRHLTWVPGVAGGGDRRSSVRLTIVIDSLRAVLTSQKR